MAFPRGLPIRRAGPMPVEQAQGNIYQDIGQGLRQTSGDVERFGMMQDMISKRQLAQRVAASKMELQQKELEFREAEQVETEKQRERDQESRDRTKQYFDVIAKIPFDAPNRKDLIEEASYRFQQVDPKDIYKQQLGRTGTAAKGWVKDTESGEMMFVDPEGTAKFIPHPESGMPLRRPKRLKTLEGAGEIIRFDPATGQLASTGIATKGAAEEARKAEKWQIDRKGALRKHNTIKLKNANQIAEITEFINLADEISKSKNLKFVTGLGAVSLIVPGTPASDLNASLQRLVGMGVIQTMAKLKAESPTGSTGFGALSQQEMVVLQNAFASLSDKKQTPMSMKRELIRLVKKMTAYMDRVQKFEAENAAELQAAPSADVGSILDDILGPRK